MYKNAQYIFNIFQQNVKKLIKTFFSKIDNIMKFINKNVYK